MLLILYLKSVFLCGLIYMASGVPHLINTRACRGGRVARSYLLGDPRRSSGASETRCRHSGVLASIVIPFSARLGKLKCRNSWGNIGFLPKKNILLRHCNDAPDIMEYFQSIIDRGASPKIAVIVNLLATCPLV